MKHRLVMYRSPKGETEGVWFRVDEPVPERHMIAGSEWTRVVEKRNGRARGLQIILDDKPVVSSASPRWHGVKSGRGFYDTYTKDGKPVITSRAALREANARAAWHGERIERVRDLE
jgi:hypothetical protein